MPEAALVAGALAAALIAPYVLPLGRVAPGRAAAVWLSALALRATLVAGGALLALALAPGTALFRSVSAATVHQPLPVVSWHPDLPGDALAHVALLLPIGAFVLWLSAFACGWLLGVVRLRAQLDRTALGSGPGDSLVVAENRILAAVPRVGPARVLVSHAALAGLDPAELDATLAHERGHLRRRHRPLRLLAGVFTCVGRIVPGTAVAARRFAFSLERDADEYAVRATGDPLALASAICKAAASGAPPRAALGLANSNAKARLDQLLAGGRIRSSPALERGTAVLAVALALTNISSLAALAALVGPRPGALLLAVACGG